MALDIGSLVEFEDKPTAKAATKFDIGSMVEYDDSQEVKQRASTVTGIATQYNPEQIANSRNLGRQVGIPDDVAERNPEAVRRKFISQKVEQLYDNSPVTGRKLADPSFAKIAHDLTDELSGNETAIKQLALTKQGFRAASELSRAMSDSAFSQHVESARNANVERSIGDVALGFGRSVAAGVGPRVGQGVYGALASPFGALAPLLDWTAGTILPANPLRVAEQGLLDLSKQQANIADAVAGDKTEQGFIERAVNSGFESMGMNLPPLLAGVISNNPALALNAMVSLTGGQEYAKAREQGLNANQALVYAGSQTAVEWATEKLPVETLFKGLRENTGLLKTVLLTNVQEQLGEQAARVLQDLNEWAVLNPDKPFTEYVKERPEAALQTAIATLVGTTGQVAIAKSIEAAGNYVSTEQEKIQYQSDSANQTLQAFANIQQLAEQSKLKQRSSQDFATFLQEAGGENGIDEVFIDARTFAQEAEAQGVDLNVLLQSSPVINQQLQDAIAQGVDLIIPVGEFGSVIAGTDFGNVLLPHLRADENGISAFEAKNQLDGAMEALQAEAAQVSDKYVNDQAWQASLTEVGDNLLGQLNTVGRFAPEHNQAYVNGLVAPWYSTLANELGVTPSEAFARYPLRVSDQANAQGFEQGIDLQSLRDQLKSAQQEFDDYDAEVRNGVDPEADKYWGLSDKVSESERTFAESLVSIPDNIFGIKAKANDGRVITLNPSAQQSGKYQLTRFAKDGTPWGDTQYETKQQAVKDFLNEVDAGTVRDFGGKLNQANNGNFDPNDANILNQENIEAKLSAIHNLSEDNLIHAEKMGGLSVPSIGIVTDTAGGIDGFGGITLIGGKSVADPKNNPVFSSDAYTARFPSPEWGKVKSSDAMKIINEVRDTAMAFEDRYLIDATYDSMVNYPKPDDVLHKWMDSSASKALFLKEQGVTVKPIMRPSKPHGLLDIAQLKEIKPIFDKIDLSQGYDSIVASEPYKQLTAKYKEMVLRRFEGVDYEIRDSFGEFSFSKFGVLERDLKEAGKPELDKEATSKAITKKMTAKRVVEFKKWVENKILPPYGDPFLTINRKKEPYTLPNIVRTMTLGATKGTEKTMTFGAGNARAAANVKFKTLEQMRKLAATSIADYSKYENIKAESEKLLERYRDAVVEYTNARTWNNKPDTWEALDSSMRAIAKWATNGRTEASLRVALKAEDFNVDAIPAEVIKLGVEAGNALINAPVPYFESKPQRAVTLNEFKGAVIPKNTSKEAKAILKKHGIKFTEYSGEDDRVQTIRAFTQSLADSGQDVLFQKGDNNARGQISFGSDITQGANIALLKTADASTFIHELGHFFLEVYADIASKPDAPQKIVDDMNALLEWFGIESTEQPALDVWRNMSIEQKRAYHEKLARGFEQYTFEGNAPSLALAKVFSKLRSFMLSAYKSLKKFFERSGDPALSPEVRMIFERMLASDEAIAQAQAARGMLPMFASMQDAGMSVDEYAEYLNDNQDATDQAKTDLTQRALRDLQWLRGARNKVLRGLQKQAREQRQVVRMAVRRDVMTQPIYQAYAWLKQTPNETKAQQAEKVKATQGVDTEHDSLLTAIAKLGGLNRDLASSEWGIDPADKQASGVFGKPVLRKEGGLSVDGMAEALAQYGYLTQDEHGKWDLHEFEDKFFEESRGDKQFSVDAEGAMLRQWQQQLYDQAQLDATGKGKFNLEIMQGLYTDDAWRKLGVGRSGMVMSEGYHPDAVAELFGFASGDNLIQALINAQPPKDLIEDMTDKAMLEQFGDLIDDKKMQEAADKAVHNDIRARVLAAELATELAAELATELAAQNKALGNRRVLEEAAKQYAENKIAASIVRDIKPNKFTKAETKSAKLAEQAMRKGDTQTVVQAKRDQLLNNRSAKAAMDALDEIEKYIKKVRSLQKGSVQDNMRGEPLLQMLAILDRFDFRSSLSNTQLEAMRNKEPLAAWLNSEADRLVAAIPSLPDFVLNEQFRKSYKDMTLAELRELMDAIKQIEFLARREEKQYKEIRNQNFQQEKAALLTQIKTTYPKAFDDEGNVKADIAPLMDKLEDRLAKDKDGVLGSYLNINSMAEILDGGSKLGAAFDSLVSRYSAASDYKSNALSAIYKRLKPFLRDQYSMLERRNFGTKDIGSSVLGIAMTREQALVTALLYGNAEGRQRLGNRFNEVQLQQVLGLLEAKDWQLATELWSVMDDVVWPELKALNERTIGIAPPKVAALPIDTKFGQMRGGYFPLSYLSKDNPQANIKVQEIDASKALDELRAGLGLNRNTRQGASKERVTQSKLVPNLSLKVFSDTLNETVHDIAFREALSDSMRLLRDKDISLALKNSLGDKHYQAMKQRISEIAVPEHSPSDWMEKALTIARKNTVATLLSGATTALQNFTGIMPALTKVNGAYVAKSLAKFYSTDMVKQVNFAVENSAYMKSRVLEGYDKDVRELAKDLSVENKLLPSTKYALMLMGLVDAGTSIPVWHAAYQQAMQEYDNDTTRATQFADAVIQSTMGSGRAVDQPTLTSGVGRAAAFKQLFLMFFNYFQAQGQRLVVAGAISKQQWQTDKVGAISNFTVKYVFIVALPALLTEFIFGWGDDDDDEYMKRAFEALVLYQTAMVPLVRDIARPLWHAFDSDVKAFGYKMSPVESSVNTAIRVPGSIADIFNGEGDAKDTKTVIMGASFLTGMPGKLIADVVTGTDAFMQGDAGAQAILLGPPKN